MRLALRYISLTGIAFFLSSISVLLFAQERCGTVPYTKSLHENPELQRIEFERWLSQKMPTHRLPGGARKQAGPYKIPVVVHIIHNGEPIGVGPNITDAQVVSQIRVLNEDFQRNNADAANTPPEFAGVAGSLDIEFVLARRNPEGQATTGIIRVDGGRNSWTMNDNYTLKSLSYWPAEQYFNIWVCNLTSHLGYAQFPVSDLEGLENSSTNRLTDGVVIWHRVMGSSDDGAFNLDTRFDKGRTTTHETGHFLGLNHVWGDDVGCNGTDYVADTPNQGGQTEGCPSHPRTDSCGDVIMFQNFLDYTDDECMNLFTVGQVTRMATVIENSPRRASLLTSPGLDLPDPVPNDLGIREIIFPDASVCSNAVSPVIEVRNYGNNTITSTRIRLVVDGTTLETKDFALNLGLFETAELTFNTVNIPSGNHDISFQVLQTNEGTDGGSYNDLKTSTLIVPAFGDIPFAENFNSQPPGWITYNPDGQITWQIVTAPNQTASNQALKLNYYDYEDKIGEVDMFLSPVLDFSGVPAVTLSFDVAHARYQASNDRLRVVILKDCQSYTEGTVLYDKAGEALSTTSSTTSPFTPSGTGQWRREFLDLSSFIGVGRVQIAFVGINDWGNNIYLDNLSLFTEETRDISLTRLLQPSPVTCTNEIAPLLLIKNAGSLRLQEIEIQYTLNSGPAQILIVNNLDVAFGAETEVALPVLNLAEGSNTLFVRVSDPGGITDLTPGDNEKEFVIIVNKSQDRIPLRENFEDPFAPAWTAVNPEGGMNWETIATNFGQSLYFNAYANEDVGDEAWFVSPVLDFSATSEASMLFDLSRAARNGTAETLSILASKDCGITYSEITFNRPAPEAINESWMPDDEADWHTRVSVNLNSLAGEENVRIAFVVKNQNANNVFLDNIEFFVASDPSPVIPEQLYTVYGYDLSEPELSELKITFNLPERQNVRYSVITVTGQMETDGVLTDVLNQTYPLNLRGVPPGVYFVRVLIDQRFYTSKILVY